jgi:hypothetical protein
MRPIDRGSLAARTLLPFVLMTAANALAADTPPALQIRQTTLKNGLRIVAAEDRSRPVVNLQVWYRVGSKDEKPGKTGFAHLFEHMMFRGSKNVGPEEHMRLVRQAGGVVNAYTGFDSTVYWETFPSHYLERMLWLEADRMASLDVSEENFRKEREVVKEERRLRVENPPLRQPSRRGSAQRLRALSLPALPDRFRRGPRPRHARRRARIPLRLLCAQQRRVDPRRRF